jgi:hypothetical protein
MRTAFDWRRRGCEAAAPTELMNWPVQSAGADLMRIVCIAATQAGIEVACPVHDAFLIISALERLDEDVANMREIMKRASEVVTGGLRIRVDDKTVRTGRYMDKAWPRHVGPHHGVVAAAGGASGRIRVVWFPNQGRWLSQLG